MRKTDDRRTHFAWAAAFIVPTPDRIGCGKNARSGVKNSCDTSFRYGYGLLLHGFVYGDTVFIPHLIELIDTDHTRIC